MVTPRTTSTPRFTAYVVNAGVLTQEPFALIDVGASGGIGQHWDAFGEYLIADGFEPLIAEAARLNAVAPTPRIRYHAIQVTARDRIVQRAQRLSARPGWSRSLSPWPRTSAVWAHRLLHEDYAKIAYDPAGHGVVSEATVALDEWYRDHARKSVDFLKTDTDGHDYAVLRGAVSMLHECPVLGIAVEVQFHGASHPHAETFSTIDRFLRHRGFSLLDLEPQRYSRAALPQPFAFGIPAQTTRGQVFWGEAVYMRDAGDPEYERRWDIRLTPCKAVKLACLYEVFGCEDCAAEGLLTYRDRLRGLVDVEHALDLLVPPRNGDPVGYREYMETFGADPTRWY